MRGYPSNPSLNNLEQPRVTNYCSVHDFLPGNYAFGGAFVHYSSCSSLLKLAQHYIQTLP